MVKGKIRKEESINDPLATMSVMSLKLMMLCVPLRCTNIKSKNKIPDNYFCEDCDH